MNTYFKNVVGLNIGQNNHRYPTLGQVGKKVIFDLGIPSPGTRYCILRSNTEVNLKASVLCKTEAFGVYKCPLHVDSNLGNRDTEV